LFALSTQEGAEMKAEGDRFNQALIQICTNKRNKHAITLAGEMDIIVNQFWATRETRYRKGIASLSAAGRQMVESFIEENIVPNSRAAVIESGVDGATNDPEGFLRSLEDRCYVAIHGEFPAEMQEKYDRAAEQMSERLRSQRDENSKE